MIASEQPSGLEASSSSARRRSGLGPRLERSVGCLGYAGHNVDTAYSQKLIRAFSPFRPLPSTACLAYGGERGKRTLNLAVGSSIRRRIPGRDPQANPAGTFSAEAPGLPATNRPRVRRCRNTEQVGVSPSALAA